jgi:hypothetical protein
LLQYIINSLEVEQTVVHLHLSTQPTWPQLCACLVFCLLSFLHLPSPPVRFLGQAHAGHERWCPNRDLRERQCLDGYLTMGKLEAWDMEILSKKCMYKI